MDICIKTHNKYGSVQLWDRDTTVYEPIAIVSVPFDIIIPVGFTIKAVLPFQSSSNDITMVVTVIVGVHSLDVHLKYFHIHSHAGFPQIYQKQITWLFHEKLMISMAIGGRNILNETLRKCDLIPYFNSHNLWWQGSKIQTEQPKRNLSVYLLALLRFSTLEVTQNHDCVSMTFCILPNFYDFPGQQFFPGYFRTVGALPITNGFQSIVHAGQFHSPHGAQRHFIFKYFPFHMPDQTDDQDISYH